MAVTLYFPRKIYASSQSKWWNWITSSDSLDGDACEKPMNCNTQVDSVGRRWVSGIILCIFVRPEDLSSRSIDKEIHVTPSAQEMVCRLFARRRMNGLKRHLRKRPSCPLLIMILAKSFTILVSLYINSAMQRKKQSRFDSQSIDYWTSILHASMEEMEGPSCCLSSCAEPLELRKCKWGTRWSHRATLYGSDEEDAALC